MEIAISAIGFTMTGLTIVLFCGLDRIVKAMQQNTNFRLWEVIGELQERISKLEQNIREKDEHKKH